MPLTEPFDDHLPEAGVDAVREAVDDDREQLAEAAPEPSGPESGPEPTPSESESGVPEPEPPSANGQAPIKPTTTPPTKGVPKKKRKKR